jgi:hypothetical protein
MNVSRQPKAFSETTPSFLKAKYEITANVVPGQPGGQPQKRFAGQHEMSPWDKLTPPTPKNLLLVLH